MTVIDWSWPSNKIHNWVRGLSPNPGMSSTLNSKKIRIFKTAIVDRKAGLPGSIVELTKTNLSVSTGEGVLSLLEVQIEGKRRMPIDEFLKGAKLGIGDKLGI